MVALLSFLGLLIATIPLQPRVVSPAFGATPPTPCLYECPPLKSPSVNSTTPVPLSLGFSPSTLSPVSEGVPVYTVGDTLWAMSGYNYPILLSLNYLKANISTLASSRIVDPHGIAAIYTFTSNDVDGVWSIMIGGLQGEVVIPVHFVNPANHPVSLGPLLYSLDGGNLSISTQANLGDSYDQEVCAAGNSDVSLSLPTVMHEAGDVTLIPGNPFRILTYGKVNESFSFWFELYHSYALDVVSANSLVVDNVMAAESQPITVASTTYARSTVIANATITWNVPMREGRYTLRAYFQNATSLDVVQSRVLILNESSWVSLSNACLPQTLQSQQVSYSASLTNGLASWPRTLYLMYRTSGVEAVASYPVRANVSSVYFVASPWNQSLPDVKVNVRPAADVEQTSQDGSALFVLASNYPVQLNYSLGTGGGYDLDQGSVAVNGSYATVTEQLSLAKLTVRVVSDQSSPSLVDVSGPDRVNVTSALVGSNQTSSFLLSAGSYTVTASQGDNTESAQVGLTNGLAASVTLNFNTFLTFEIILLVTAIIAVVANLAIWVLSPRGLRARLDARHSE